MGHDKSLELAEDCKTAAQLCTAVAETCDLKPGTFELQQNGTPVDDEAVAGLEAETRLTVRPQEEDMELVLLVLAIQDAAQKAGRGAEVTVNKGASDDTIAKLEEEVGDVEVPACVEKLLRHCDGVSFGCPQSGCGANMPSVKEIVHILGYSDASETSLMPQEFAHTECLPWMSIDCDFAFLVLDISDTAPVLWLIDQECQSSTCFGTLEDVLKAVLNYYEENVEGQELSLPERVTSASASECGLHLHLDVMGHDKSLELAEDLETAAQLCTAVAEACDLKPGTFFLYNDGKLLNNRGAYMLCSGERLTVVRARTGGLQVHVDVMGHNKSLVLAEDCNTEDHLCAAVAEACGLKPSMFELHREGKSVDDEAVARLEAETRFTVFPTRNRGLVLLVLAIQAAAQKAGCGAEVTVNNGASDDTIAQLKDEVGRNRVPMCVENLLRHCDGVSFGCPQSGCGANMPSVEDILEIHGYSDVMRQKFARIKCLPWMSIDCDKAFLVLDISRPAPILWLIDQECRTTTCFGKLEEVLKAVLNYYEENEGEGQELSLPEGSGIKRFAKRFLC